MGGPDFAQCAIEFVGNGETFALTNPSNVAQETAMALYGYTGNVIGFQKNVSTLISYQGCLELCGSGSQYYSWSNVSNTFLTWVFPTLGILLQAPFERGGLFSLTFAMARWIGSPMACLAYSLWNIANIGKCALLVDLATPATERIPDDDSDFSNLRDSFFLLTIMNQFTIKTNAALKRETEGLLRLTLFSGDLKLKGENGTLNEHRKELARTLRVYRKRGVVPAFITCFWFLFSMAVSIQQAFGLFGDNAEAHDLALGLLLAWLPVLVLCSTVDRDFVAPEEVCDHLNELVNEVIESLVDPDIVQEYMQGFDDLPEAPRMKTWITAICAQCREHDLEDMFEEFAGQGRTRFHYGAAHPILVDIERSYIAERGRGWFANPHEARAQLVLGRVEEGLFWFDTQEIWEISGAIIIVTGTIAGAFALSFFTPTIGLGCRSGGYLVFWLVSLILCLGELWFWYVQTMNTEGKIPEFRKPGERPRRLTIIQKCWLVYRWMFWLLKKVVTLAETTYYSVAIAVLKLVRVPERHVLAVSFLPETNRLRREEWTIKDWTHFFWFRPLEFCNMTWLFYIVMAQTLGSYRTCACQSSLWGTMGGYISFAQYDDSTSAFLLYSWPIATVIATATMGLPMLYIVSEWCLQSHLSAERYDSMRSGLRQVRQYRRFMFPLLVPFRLLVSLLTCYIPRKIQRVRWSYRVMPKSGRNQIVDITEGRSPNVTPMYSKENNDEGIILRDMDPKKTDVRMAIEEVDGGPEGSVFSRTNTDQTMVAYEADVLGVRQP